MGAGRGEGAEVYVVDVAAAEGVKWVWWRMGKSWFHQSNGWEVREIEISWPVDRRGRGLGVLCGLGKSRGMIGGAGWDGMGWGSGRREGP